MAHSIKGYSYLSLLFVLAGLLYYLGYTGKSCLAYTSWPLDPFRIVPTFWKILVTVSIFFGTIFLHYWHLSLFRPALKQKKRGANMLSLLLLLASVPLGFHPSLSLSTLLLFLAYHLSIKQQGAKNCPYEAVSIGFLVGIATLLRPPFLLYLFLFPLLFIPLKIFRIRNILAYGLGGLAPAILLTPFLLPYAKEIIPTIDLERWIYFSPLWRKSIEENLPLYTLFVSITILFFIFLSKVSYDKVLHKASTNLRISGTLLLFLPFFLALLDTHIIVDILIATIFFLAILYEYACYGVKDFSPKIVYTLIFVVLSLNLYSIWL